MTAFQCQLDASNAYADANTSDITALLVQYDPYLVRQAQEYMHQHPGVVRPELLDLETDELTQRVRIKFWHALEDKHIEYPRTYIKRIVHSEFIDLVRRLKPQYTQDLPVDEEGELYQGRMLVSTSAGMADPSVEYEEQFEASSRIEEVVDAVLHLPERQQHAMICDMRDRVDDLDALSKAFKKRKADLETWQWPQEQAEKLLLRASLAYARQKVGMSMKDAEYIQELYMARKKRRAAC